MTVVSGPAGAGKTVACGSWASAAPAGRRVAWLTLDADDQDPARFWGYVRAALAGAGAVPGDAAQALRDAAAGGLPLRVAEAAQQLTEPVTLVLDDVHELADGPVLAGLDLLIRHAPPTLRLILERALRTPAPAGPAARGRRPGRRERGGPGLHGRTRRTPTSRCSASTWTRSRGMSCSGAPRAGWPGSGWRPWAPAARCAQSGRITDIAGDEPLVTDYLWDEVLGRQPPEIRLFMLRTSVTEQMSGDLADALTGEPGGARTLERLSRENSFVEALGNDHAGVPLPPAAARRARRRAGPGDPARSPDPAAPRGALARSARPGRSTRCAAPPRRGTGTTPRTCWPKPVSPRWCAAARRRWSRCWRCSRRSSARTTPPWRRRWPRPGCGPATRTAPAHHLEAAQRAIGRCSQAARRSVEPWLAALRVMRAASRSAADPGLLAQGWSMAEQAQATAGTQPEHRALGLLWFALGAARLRRWEILEARYALDHAARQLTAGGLGELCARARGWQALAEAWHGDLTAAEKALGEPAQRRHGPRPGLGVPGRARCGAAWPGPRRPCGRPQAAGRRGRVRGGQAPASRRAAASASWPG